MPLLCLIQPLTLPQDSPRTNCCSVGSPIYRVCYRKKTDVQYTYDNYVKELQSRLQSSYQTARNNLESRKESSKEYYDRNVNTPLFVLGDKILLHHDKVRRGRSPKLTTPWIGPYEIVGIDDVNVTLRLPRNRTVKVHAIRLKPFFG